MRVDEPLKICKKIKKKDDSSLIVNFIYEKLRVFCFIYGRLGHSESFCDKHFVVEEKDIVREWVYG